jgi:Protein of unknown function (DUF1592)/Protein of unknown function (DUF1588)/Protein of unknown function (DUF1585)/Protein of unknown function (DUF1595)/Protein of unknown function (DUF1587)/Planctomycete cytochrome C
MLNHFQSQSRTSGAWILRCLFVVGMTSLTLAAAVESEIKITQLSRQILEPFIKNNCLRCHGPGKEKGHLRLDQLSFSIGDNKTASRWQDVLDALNAGEMPPTEEKQPDKKVLMTVLGQLTDSLFMARKRLADRGGEIAMRRLNQREYNNTTHEIFGFILPPGMAPEDDDSEHFDTNGSEQFFSTYHQKRYLELGRELVREGFNWSSKPLAPVSITRDNSVIRANERIRKALDDGDAKMALYKAGKTFEEIGFHDEGELKIFVSQFKMRVEDLRLYLQEPLTKTGLYLQNNNFTVKAANINRSADPRASYRLRIHGGIHGEQPLIRHFIFIADGSRQLGAYKMPGTTDEPGVIELPIEPLFGQSKMSITLTENRPPAVRIESYLTKIASTSSEFSIWVSGLELEGPFYREPSFFQNLVAKYKSTSDDSKDKKSKVPSWDDAQAKPLLEEFAFEAFRHQAADKQYLNQLLDLFTLNRKQGMDFEQAIIDPLAIILSSPQFLYLNESRGNSSKPITLDNRELAIRLAYFLWSSPPDKELYARAADGSLGTNQELTKQVDRLLNSPKAASFMESFMGQWMNLKRFDGITVDKDVLTFNDGIRLAVRKEPLEFFKVLTRENLSVTNLIKSDFIVINALLSQHYGIPGITTNTFEKVSLPSDSVRGGLISQASFLMIGSNGERTSPVIRGALVMEKLLHDKPAPPPPNVPELDQVSKTPLSLREAVALHQNKAQCGSCHVKMDAIGFGLENFDMLGQWREQEKVGNKFIPIDTGGTLPGGDKFTNLKEYKSILLKHKAKLAQSMVESLLAYSIGRDVGFSDANTIDGMLKKLSAADYRVRSMIHAVVASATFRQK